LLDHLSLVGPGAGNGGFDEVSVALVMAALQVSQEIYLVTKLFSPHT